MQLNPACRTLKKCFFSILKTRLSVICNSLLVEIWNNIIRKGVHQLNCNKVDIFQIFCSNEMAIYSSWWITLHSLLLLRTNQTTHNFLNTVTATWWMVLKKYAISVFTLAGLFPSHIFFFGVHDCGGAGVINIRISYPSMDPSPPAIETPAFPWRHRGRKVFFCELFQV